MKYEADIDLNKPFSYDDYDAYAPHTAIVTVYNDDGSVKDKREYGYKTIEEIQNELKKTNILELSHCYVKELKNIHGTIQSVHAFRTIFHNITEFNIKVTDEANFSHAVFIGKTTFSGTEFCGQVDFGNAIFMEYTSFWGSKFYGNTYFNYVTFYSDATFRDINSSKYIRFGNVVFHSTIEFSEASNSSTIEFNTVLFKGVSKLDFYSAHKFIFNSCMIEKTCDIRFDTHVDKLSISNCINIGYFSLPFNKMIKEAIYKFNSSDYIGGWIADIKADFTNAISILDNFWGYEFNRKRVNYRYKAEEFNFLKVNYNRIGEYEYEDAAYLEFRRCKRKMNGLFRRFFSWLIFDLISCYCTKPFRVFWVAIVTIFAFAGLFYLSTILPNVSDAIKYGLNYTGKHGCLYHSLITFFTIGYGDSQPIGDLGLFLTGLEGFIGVFLMSLFTVSFVRKVLR